jgi:cell fate regulator YaaT (PSP1 superfamily)
LKYEDQDYSELKKDAPRYGARFKHDGVDYKITGVNLLSRTVKIESADKEIIKVVSFEEVDGMMK